MALFGKKSPIGAIAFLFAVFGAIVLGLLSGFGLFEGGATMSIVLVVAGVVVGLLNISKKEAVPIMVSALMLGIGSGVLALIPYVGNVLEAVFSSLAFAIVPVGIVVAISTFVAKAKA